MSGKRSRLRAAVFGAVAAAFALAALFHIAALGAPSIGESSPVWRHALFVAVNAALCVLMVRRPRWFPYAFTLLCAQQLYSHAVSFVHVLADQRRMDWASLVVLLAMPVVTALLWMDAVSSPPRSTT